MNNPAPLTKSQTCTMSRSLLHPEPGFYRMRLVKGGVYVPALIYTPCPAMPCEFEIDPSEWFTPQDRSRVLQALINGKSGDPERVWTSGARISKSEYDFMLADAEWCEAYAPDDPRATPYKAVEFSEIPQLF